MKKLCVLSVMAVAAFLVQCTEVQNEKIPDGVYREPSGVEAIAVQGEYLNLTMNMTKGSRLGVQTGRYKYLLLSERQLKLIGSSNDEFFLQAVMNYDWVWDGASIVRKKRDSREKVVFSR